MDKRPVMKNENSTIVRGIGVIVAGLGIIAFMGMVMLGFVMLLYSVTWGALGSNYNPNKTSSGGFYYEIKENRALGTYVELNGLRSKYSYDETVPLTIEGKEVYCISRPDGEEEKGLLESENLTQLYVEAAPFVNAKNTFRDCPKLKQIIFENSYGFRGFKADLHGDQKVYVTSYGRTEESGETAVAGKLDNEAGDNYYYANVSFMWNYEGAPNNGYFWVKNGVYGKDTSLEDCPTRYEKMRSREGYKFSGWYKEPECINMWMSDDKLPEAKYNANGEEIYQETRFYAKWEIRDI